MERRTYWTEEEQHFPIVCKCCGAEGVIKVSPLGVVEWYRHPNRQQTRSEKVSGADNGGTRERRKV